MPKHIAETKANYRKLYDKHVDAEKWKFVVTLDEAWVYLSDCTNKRSISITQATEMNVRNGFVNAQKCSQRDL